MFALLSDEALKEAYGDYRHSQGLEEGREEGMEQLAEVFDRLLAGETREKLLASGITAEVVERAEKLVDKVKA
jgi:hypothetical protein